MRNLPYGAKEIKDILAEVEACTIFFHTKDGKVYSDSAEKFLTWINEYTKYCIPETVEIWKSLTQKIIYGPFVLRPGIECTPEIQNLIDSREYKIINDLFNFIDAGEIMEVIDTTHSWDEVSKTLKEQGHSGYTFSGLSNIMLQFSPYGVEFVDRFDSNRRDINEEFKKAYNEAKKKNEERHELNQRLVNVLARKITLENNK